MADVNWIGPDPGAVMVKIRQWVQSQFINYLVNEYTLSWSFGTTHGKQSVSLHVTGEEEDATYNFISACLESGDVMPFRCMIQLPGFEGWTQIGRAEGTDPAWPFSTVVAYWKANIAEIKQEMINTWSYGSPRAIIYDEADIISGEVKSNIAIIPVADSDGMSVSRELLYMGTEREPGDTSYYWEDANSGVPGGVAGTNVDMSGLVEAVQDLSMVGWDIGFNHGGTIFSARSNIIVG